MYVYIVKRVLFFLPAIFLIILFSFLLLQYSPGNPVDRLLNKEGVYESELSPSQTNEAIRTELTRKLGLNLPVFYFSFSSLKEHKVSIHKNTSEMDAYIPYIRFNSHNQMQRWLVGDGVYSKGIINGDFGNSWVSGQSVSSILAPRVKWSLLLTLISVFLAYIISIPIGIYSAAVPHSLYSRILNIVFAVLFSIPVFWLATLLMLVFCNPYVLDILPSTGVSPAGGFQTNLSFSKIIINTIPYLILPVICYTYSSLAFLSGIVRTSINDVLREDYIRTARAKGLSEKAILLRHAFRNSLLPLITIFSHVLPLAFSGSVIIETIFTIPGMGLAIFQSLSAQDYPVIISVFLITGVLTMISFLLSDILYALADPRISFNKKSAG